MKLLLLSIIFCFSMLIGFSQSSSLAMVRFACDTCSGNHNPLAYSGGNIVSVDIIDSPGGKYLKLVSGPSIDTNATPAYFDIYVSQYTEPHCSSFRSQNMVMNLEGGNGRLIVVKYIPNMRFWLASSDGKPGPGESTFQIDALNSSSKIIIEGPQLNYGYSTPIGNPLWENWAGKSKINMFGFTALTPNTEYSIYEVWIGYQLPVRLASYDCSLPNAVKDATLEEKIKIFPSPASDYINIDLPDSNNEYLIQLISHDGIIVKEGNYNASASMPLSNITKGLYLVKITSGDRYFAKKIIKE